ncbi:MAG: M23 family metallopeptidase, partial [Candidatus Bathyarchaeota archaeon]|nr:M23 family metallopeptidase [Candidatus Bathyarchaeota archaeon]
HIEGLDHVWIESTSTMPVMSWANGTVEYVEQGGDEEGGEYHIGISYGDNLFGVHMEILTPLVEEGDIVAQGDPIGYGMDYFGGLQSAELSLLDYGRTDGVYNGGSGVYVSPFDYLVDSERVALAEAYIENVIEPLVETGVYLGMFDPAQPYFTNPLLIHYGHDGRLQGEWYLISENWTTGYPNDIITIIEAENPYYSGAKIFGMDDESMGGMDNWNFASELQIDYETSRIQWTDNDGQKAYGIFSIDESEERAKLTIQYQKGTYPTEFTDAAQQYIERSYLSRRRDAVELGVLPDF